jgi:hypothetical protein
MRPSRCSIGLETSEKSEASADLVDYWSIRFEKITMNAASAC